MNEVLTEICPKRQGGSHIWIYVYLILMSPQRNIPVAEARCSYCGRRAK